MKIIITGDSHTAALKLGADMLLSEGSLPKDCHVDVRPLGPGNTLRAPFFIDKGAFAEMNIHKGPRYVKSLPVPEAEGIYDYYGICGPLHTIRVWRNGNHWQKHTPLAPQGDQAPISSGLLRHVVLQDQFYMMQLIALLKRVGVKVFVIEAPRPYRHHPVLERVGSDVVSYIDGFYRNVMRSRLAAEGVPVVELPQDCYGDDGFMNEIYRSETQDDLHHANRQFGAMMIKEVIKFVKAGNHFGPAWCS